MAKPSGKYADVIPRLEALPPEDLNFQQRVDAAVEDVRNGSIKFVPLEGFEPWPVPDLTATELAKLYVACRKYKDVLEEREKGINLMIAAIVQAMSKSFEGEGVNSVKLDSGDSVSISPEPVVKVEDPQAFRKWCVDEGMSDMLTLHSKTTEGLVKKRLLEGQPEPPGIKAYFRDKVTWR